jgi:hypothetical protein
MGRDDWPRNPRVRAWLDEGHGVDALLGVPPFASLDQHWGVHDTPLVMRQIGYLVADGADPSEARGWLRSALERLVAEGRLTDALRFVRDHLASADAVPDLPRPDRDHVVAVLRGTGPVGREELERATVLAPHVAVELDVPTERLLPGARER